ncbi:MAG: hypothetical protein MSS82_05595 [Bacteroidales bacterium]|nr:hypothetical protein [Bacteroidales bacterium]
MKKITSLFAALMAVVAVNAATVTFGSADLSTSAMTKSGVTVTPAKAPSSSTNNAINTFEGVKTLRIYADATLTIDAGTNKITSVTLKLNSATNGKRLTTMTSDAGEVTVTGNPDWTATWTNEGVNKVVFTVGEKATLGSENTKAGQIHIMEIIVVTDGEGGGNEGGDDPTTKELVPEYAEANYFGTDWQILMDDSDEEGLGASFIMYLDFFNESTTQIAGTWKNFDAEYTALYTIAGTDTTLVDYTDLTLELTWMQTIDMSDYYEGYTQCGVYKINVNYTGADNVLYTIKDAILPIFTLDYSGEVADFINVTDALEDVEAMNIRVADGAIMLNADAPVQVYSVSGQLLYFATAKGEMTINGMPKNQALIVRIGDKAAKVIL